MQIRGHNYDTVNNVVANICRKKRKNSQAATSYKRYHVWTQSCNKKIIFNDLLILILFLFLLLIYFWLTSAENCKIKIAEVIANIYKTDLC